MPLTRVNQLLRSSVGGWNGVAMEDGRHDEGTGKRNGCRVERTAQNGDKLSICGHCCACEFLLP